jgi:DNA-damage-inducible protein D
MLEKRGVKPGEFPPAEDVAKVKRRLLTDGKKVLKDVKKKNKK